VLISLQLIAAVHFLLFSSIVFIFASVVDFYFHVVLQNFDDFDKKKLCIAHYSVMIVGFDLFSPCLFFTPLFLDFLPYHEN